jgi:hypothetical protein
LDATTMLTSTASVVVGDAVFIALIVTLSVTSCHSTGHILRKRFNLARKAVHNLAVYRKA